MRRRWSHIIAAVVFATMLASGVGAAHAATDTPDPPKPEPVLVIRSFRTVPATLTVGNRFKLELVLENAVDVSAENLMVTVGAVTGTANATSTTSATPSGPDVVVLGSNSRFVGKLAGGTKNRVVSFDLVSNPQGSPGPFTLPVTLVYDSRNGGRLTSVQSVGLQFTRTLVFDVGALTYPKTAMQGKTFNISVDVRNTNSFPINGVELSFESTGCDWVSRETSVGTLLPGGTGQLIATAIPQAPGPLLITLHITYKDDYNNLKRIDREVTVDIKAKPVERKAVKRSAGTRVVLFMKALIGLGG